MTCLTGALERYQCLLLTVQGDMKLWRWGEVQKIVSAIFDLQVPLRRGWRPESLTFNVARAT